MHIHKHTLLSFCVTQPCTQTTVPVLSRRPESDSSGSDRLRPLPQKEIVVEILLYLCCQNNLINCLGMELHCFLSMEMQLNMKSLNVVLLSTHHDWSYSLVRLSKRKLSVCAVKLSETEWHLYVVLLSTLQVITFSCQVIKKKIVCLCS